MNFEEQKANSYKKITNQFLYEFKADTNGIGTILKLMKYNFSSLSDEHYKQQINKGYDRSIIKPTNQKDLSIYNLLRIELINLIIYSFHYEESFNSFNLSILDKLKIYLNEYTKNSSFAEKIENLIDELKDSILDYHIENSDIEE